MPRDITCAECGCKVVARSPTQRYCSACSEARDLLRKRRWARSHKPSATQRKRNLTHSQRRKEHAREAGRIANKSAASSIGWLDPGSPSLLWLVRIKVPFSYAASKNHIYAMRSRGHVALRRESRAIRSEIAHRIRDAVANRKVAHNKVWIDIFVQKPDHRGDAVNVIDLVCDGLKEGIGIDDRWFSIRQLDWEVVKTQGQLFIGVGQDSEVDCQICSYCGQMKPLTEFNKNKRSPLGVGRECKGCRKSGRRLAKSGEPQRRANFPQVEPSSQDVDRLPERSPPNDD